jgi:hypothetical protein
MDTLNIDTVRLKVRPAYAVGTVTVIIPAFNEAGRVGAVVRAACQVEFVNQVIVVDDGSTDGTAEEALDAATSGVQVQVLKHSANQGKGQALISGVKAARDPVLIFLDADLLHLNPEHIRDLAEPVLNNQVAMSLGIFEHGRWITDLSHRMTPWLTGQRCVVAELMNDLPMDAAAGYGFETALTLQARQRGWPVQSVPMMGVSHPTQLRRSGWGLVTFKVKMLAHILRAWVTLRKQARS